MEKFTCSIVKHDTDTLKEFTSVNVIENEQFRYFRLEIPDKTIHVKIKPFELFLQLLKQIGALENVPNNQKKSE